MLVVRITEFLHNTTDSIAFNGPGYNNVDNDDDTSNKKLNHFKIIIN